MGSSRLIYLTSLGWDPQLVLQLQTKLHAGMRDDAIVIGNTFGDGPVYGGLGMSKTGENDAMWDQFVLLSQMCVPVSWSPAQNFVVYRKRLPGEVVSNSIAADVGRVSCGFQEADTKGHYVQVAASTLNYTLSWVFGAEGRGLLPSMLDRTALLSDIAHNAVALRVVTLVNEQLGKIKLT